MFLTIIASLDEKFVAKYAYLLHFSLFLLHFLPLELHFLDLCNPIATFSRPVDTKYVAILVFFLLRFATFFAPKNIALENVAN